MGSQKMRLMGMLLEMAALAVLAWRDIAGVGQSPEQREADRRAVSDELQMW